MSITNFITEASLLIYQKKKSKPHVEDDYLGWKDYFEYSVPIFGLLKAY